MNCTNCGKEISADFKLCPYCGNALAAKHTSIKPPVAKEQTAFTLAGRTLSFSNDILEYNELRCRFFKYATDLEDKYIEFYNSKEHTFDAVFDVQIPQVIENFKAASKFGVSILMEFGIEDIDLNGLDRLASKRNDFINVFDNLYDKADQIGQHANYLAAYRNAQQASRSRWQGGGFGIGGAIKGALTAGALNLGTNMFRGIGDSLTNASDKAEIKKMKEELANSNDTFKCLHNAVYDYCKNVFYSVKEILVDAGLISELHFEVKRSIARANNYLSQYDSANPDDETYDRTVDAICKCINNAPYATKLYYNMYTVLKDSKTELHELAKFFGVERDYKALIIEHDKSVIASAIKNNDGTIAGYDKLIATLETKQSENPYLTLDAGIAKLVEDREMLIEEEHGFKIIKRLRDEVNNANATNGRVDTLWGIAESGNVYAEALLIAHYSKWYRDFLRDTEGISARSVEDILEKVRIRESSLTAMFIIAHIEDSVTSKPILQCAEVLAQRNAESDKVFETILPVYHVGYNALMDRTERKTTWTAKNSGLSKKRAFEYIQIAAKHLYPPALKLMTAIYGSGQYGLVPINKQKADHYTKLYNAYQIKGQLNTGLTNSSCFITTAVCKSFGKPDDCYELTAFRNYRDNWLINQPDGTALIEEYYKIAPTIVHNIDCLDSKSEIYRAIWDKYLCKCLDAINRNHFEECKKIYYEMVEDLHHRYY